MLFTSKRSKSSASWPRFDSVSENRWCPVQSAYLGIEHFALSGQSITLLHQGVDLFATLQNTLDLNLVSILNGIRAVATYRLVQNNLRLIKLLLDLHNAVGLARVLVLDNVVLELRQGARIFT